jgi:signal transduction histidine kinase
LPPVRRSPALLAFILALALAAVALAILVMPWNGNWPAAVVATALVVPMSSYSIPSFGGVNAQWSASELLILAFCFAVGPPAILGLALGQTAGSIWRRRPGTVRTTFNLFNHFLDNVAAWLVFRTILGPRPDVPTLALAGVVAAIAYALLNNALLVVAQQLAHEDPNLLDWLRHYRITIAIDLAFGLTASAATVLYRLQSIWGILTLIFPAVIFQASLVALSRRADETDRAHVREAEALKRAAEASTVERERIAADIHDGVVQNLAGLSFRLDGYARVDPATLTPDQVAGVVGLVEQAATTARGAARDLRTLLIEIAPPRLRAHGLQAALEDLVAVLVPGPTPEIRLEVCEEACPDAAGRALAYRVAQEALRNCVKYAAAATVDVRVAQDAGDLVVSIRDDGRGFSPDELARRQEQGHVGLGLLERTALDGGGVLRVDSTPGRGTVVELRLTPALATKPPSTVD